MKKILTVACTTAALAVPGVAVAQEPPTSSDKQQAQKTCKQLRSTLGKKAFAELFGGKQGIGHCIKKETRENTAERVEAQQEAKQNAAKQCKAERESLGQEAFTQKYGGKRNAYGKCVSQTAKQEEQEQAQQDAQEDKNQVNAAKECKKQRKDDPAKFAEAYGTKRNAFGKCVSKTAQAKNDEQEQEQPAQS